MRMENGGATQPENSYIPECINMEILYGNQMA